jgi:hypothetical protein
MKIAVFWVVAPCSLVEVYQRFRGPCCLHHQGDEMTSNCRFLPTGIYPCSFCLHSFIMAFIYIMKSIGESPQPCLTPKTETEMAG